jgi:hypothetical protein
VVAIPRTVRLGPAGAYSRVTAETAIQYGFLVQLPPRLCLVGGGQTLVPYRSIFPD